MSEPTAPARRYSGGQIAMLVIGVILLLPGLCSLGFLVVMFNDLLRGNTIVQAIVPLWIVSFAISAGGVALITVVRNKARADAARPDRSPTS